MTTPTSNEERARWLEQKVRRDFEQECFAFYMSLRARGAFEDTPERGDDTPEAMFWRTNDGRYGVAQIEAAWVGYNWARNKYARESHDESNGPFYAGKQQPEDGAPTFYQIGLLHHTLGLSARQREPFRNHFVAGDGHADLPELLALVGQGLMKEAAQPGFLSAEDRLFKVTDLGRQVAIAALPPAGKTSPVIVSYE